MGRTDDNSEGPSNCRAPARPTTGRRRRKPARAKGETATPWRGRRRPMSFGAARPRLQLVDRSCRIAFGLAVPPERRGERAQTSRMAWTAAHHVLFWIRLQARRRAASHCPGESGSNPAPHGTRRLPQRNGSRGLVTALPPSTVEPRRFVAAQQHLRAYRHSLPDGSREISC